MHPSIFIFFLSYYVPLKGRFKFVCKGVLSYVVCYLRAKWGGGKGGQLKVFFALFFVAQGGVGGAGSICFYIIIIIIIIILEGRAKVGPF